MEITSSIIEWYNKNKRDLPWRRTKDPYKIWLSEIILQQTRVQQGLPYFNKFEECFPSILDFAAAEEQQILTLWQGLGYYSRARNMHHTAKVIVANYGGSFPSNYEEILKLKGVGEYTAAAISSFAFDLPYPVLDGNVYRVLARYFGITAPIDKPAGQKIFKETLQHIFDRQRPALWNQAIMEFGALQCTPKAPKCEQCPLLQSCEAKKLNQVDALPFKAGKTKVQNIDYSYFIFRYKDKTYIRKRLKGTWKNMFEFPLVEYHVEKDDIKTSIAKFTNSIQYQKPNLSSVYECKHLLSHRRINAKFYTIYLESKPVFSKSDIFEIELGALGEVYPVSTLIKKYLDQKIDDK